MSWSWCKAFWKGFRSRLGCGFSLGIGPRHIEILPTPTGKPELRFTGPALERARQLGVRHIHVSITHERTTAAAVVVLEA